LAQALIRRRPIQMLPEGPVAAASSILDQRGAGNPQVALAKNRNSSVKLAELEALKSGHHAAHMNLTKEQITIFSDDISQLRQDVLQLQQEVGLANGQDRLRGRPAFPEKGTSDSFGRHNTTAMDDPLRSHDGRRASLDSRVSNVEHALGQIPQRIALLEQDCRQVAENHGERVTGLQVVSDTLSAELSLCREDICTRLGSLEQGMKESVPRQMKMVADVQVSYDSLLRAWEEHKLDHASLPQRLGFLEKQVTGSEDKMNKMSVDLWRSVDGLRRAHAQDAALHGRVASLESELGRLAEKYGRELGECQTRNDKVAKELVSLESRHTATAERTTTLERQLGDAADELTRMSEENGAIRAGVLQDVQEWLSTMRERLEFFGMEVANWSNKHTKAIEDVKRLSNDSTERLHAHHVAMAERTDHVESTMTKFSEKYCRMLSDLHHQHAELSSNSESILSTMRDRLELFGTEMRHSSSSHAKAIEDVKRTSDDSAHKHHARHLAMAERLDHLENTVAEVSERHCRMLSDLQRQHAELSSGGESVPDRVTRVEQQQRDSADRFAKDLQTLHRSREQLESRIAEIRGESDGCRVAVAERVDALERAARDEAGRQAKELAALRQAHQELRQAHLEHAGHVSRAAVEERIGSVERRGSKQVDDLRGELLRHRALTEGRLEACEALLHRELSSAQDRARLIARELQRDVDTKTALVNKLTRSESSPSLSSASLRVGRGAQSSTPSLCSLAQSRWGSGALRRGEVARLPLDAESGRTDASEVASPASPRLARLSS